MPKRPRVPSTTPTRTPTAEAGAAPNPFAPPPYAPPALPPVSVRLAALPRMTVTLAVALAGAWRLGVVIDRVATRMLPDSEPAPRLAAQLTVAATVAFLLAAWAWLDPALARAGFGAPARFAASSLCCLVSTSWVVALPMLHLAFCAWLGIPGARSALTVVLVTPVTPLVVWAPAFWSGELVGALLASCRSTRPERRESPPSA